jgi:ubiquinone/menaquinone biosynthesis C-methylase UbiE
MTKLEFDDEFSRLMEEFNVSPGAIERRARILAALNLKTGTHVLDVGSGPGHLAYEIAQVIGPDGRIEGVDSAEGSVETGRRRCAGLENASFTLGDAYGLPYDDGTFDTVMSSQVFEYLEDVAKALGEMFRVLKPGGRVLIHGTGWGALLWHSQNPERMSRILKIWDGHLADPKMSERMAKKLHDTGFVGVQAEPIVHMETSYDPTSMSAIMAKFVGGYVVSQGISQAESDAWAEELPNLGSSGDYFFSSNEYIFAAQKP